MPRRAPSGPRRPSRRGRWRLVLLVGALGLLAALYYRPVHSYLRTQSALSERSAEVRSLDAEKRSLEQRLAVGASGTTLVRRARRLGLVEPGERLFIVKGIAAWRRARQTSTHAR
ncbi:MAG: hypothetical protein C5B48_15850 [Candidatus Rokuibacteriota bacterium]|nr:MAG: hypothetical protein C5B48_15850 [Candidatus Rokubacteria bacterium]